MRGVIVAGTDTGVGKTVLSAFLMSAMPDALYWKPIQSGLLEETDSETVARLSQCDPSRIVPEAYRLTQPLSPHLSARLEGIRIDAAKLSLPNNDEFLIVETAGGVLVPLLEDLLQIEMVREWGLPVIIAARSTLGTINHTLLTIEALRARATEIFGVVTIGPLNPENENAIQEYGNVTVIGRICPMSLIDHRSILSAFEALSPEMQSLLQYGATLG